MAWYDKTPLESNNAVPVNVQDQHSDAVELYMHVTEASPAITADTAIDDESVAVDALTGVGVGDAITIREGVRSYQSLVTSSADLTIGLASPLDFAFTTAAGACVGAWNIAVDGSETAKVAMLHVPPGASFDIYSIAVNMTDETAMDSAKFGGIAALSTGILFRSVNGHTKNLPLIVNNKGFFEIGFNVTYDSKAPSGVYGLSAVKNYSSVNGVSLRLDGATDDRLELHIRDDLTGLTSMNITCNGHVVTN